MKKDDLFEMKEAEYSGFFTKIIIQSSICITILVSVFFLKTTSYDLIDEINICLHEDMQWNQIYEVVIQLKNRVLH